MDQPTHSTVVVIGSGFGGAMTALTLARAFQRRTQQDPTQHQSILILERGTWWTTPVGTVQDREVLTYDFLVNKKQQPTQYWSSHTGFKGFLDIATRCLRKGGNTDGLFELDTLGPTGLARLWQRGDGVSILRANGVGGGSLVYSNITIRPPDLIFNDPRWAPLTWSEQQRHAYYNLARDAIGTGIVFALNERETRGGSPFTPVTHPPIAGTVTAYVAGTSISVLQRGHTTPTLYPLAPGAVVPPDVRVQQAVWLYTIPNQAGEAAVTRVVLQGPWRINPGLSNIVTRSARVPPYWLIKGEGEPFNPRGLKQLAVKPLGDPLPAPPTPIAGDLRASLWIDRARVFQQAVSTLTDDFGAVDLAIGDLPPEPAPYDPQGSPRNYCERQGRCNVGCLPGARHTLNKQLMAAILGRPNMENPEAPLPPLFTHINLEPLAEVDYIEARAQGGYTIHYDQQDTAAYIQGEVRSPTRKVVTADIVIVAAGCLGTNAIMLRSKEHGLPHVSDSVGEGFSTNGDYLAFLEKTARRVRLTRGPVTTSFAHFNTADPGTSTADDLPKFHTIEDQGIPPALASLLGVGLPLLRSLAKGRNRWLFVFWALVCWSLKQARLYITAPFKNHLERQDMFRSEDEVVANMMCVVAMGREAAVGKFRLGGAGETTLRAQRTDGLPFYADPVYTDVEKTLARLAETLKAEEGDTGRFINPFLTSIFRKFNVDSITLSHPLGGCRIAADVTQGVVDEFGRVFDKTKQHAEQPWYKGLYIADASIMPTALGVNPSLTIAALALRIADKIIADLDDLVAAGTSGRRDGHP